MPHLGITLLLAALLASTMAATGERTLAERLHYAIYVFAGSVGVVCVGGWIMFLIET